MTPFRIEPLAQKHQAWARQFLTETWGTPLQVTRGTLYDVLEFPGFVGIVDDQPQGISTYRIEETECEVLILQSSVEAIGIGSALIDHIKQKAIEAGCKRLWLITTNDNIHAIRWYQRQGFTIAAVHTNALAESRKIKPQIPLIGQHDIPLRDEIEFEINLS